MATKNIFLVANYVAMPKNPKLTAQPGYMSNPDNIQYDERIYVARGIRDKDLQNRVILDLTEEKIIKNSFQSGASFDELFQHYYNAFGDYIDDCVNTLNEKV